MKPEEMTAWALDELSDEERAQIEALLKEDAVMQSYAGKTKSFCDFLTAELREDSIELAAEQRERLQSVGLGATSATLAPTKPARLKQPSFWRRHVVVNLAAAAAVVMGTTILIRKQMETETAHAEAAALTGRMEFESNAPRPPVRLDEAKEHAFAQGEPALAPMIQSESPAVPKPALIAAEPAARRVRPSTESPVPVEVRVGESGNDYWENTQAMPSPPPPSIMAAQFDKAAPKDSRSVPAAGAGLLAAAPKTEQYPIAPGGPPTVLAFMDRDAAVETRTHESYSPIRENKLQDVRREPLSTFSIDVDTASYANVRRFLNHNSVPPTDAVRVEELINYFPTSEQGPAAAAKEPFAVRVEMATCPWEPRHQLARIAIKGRSVPENRQPGNLVFLVDVSGSMNEPDKLPLVQKSLRMLAEQLGENDRVSMVTYAGGTQVVLPSTNGLRKPDILAAIDRLQAGGGTHGSAGIRLAYEQAAAGFIKGGINRVVLCSDGDFNVGISDPEELETYITEKARSGVFLSALGYGRGNLKDRTMETLADKGNGNYAYIDSFGEARKVLVDQINGTLVTIAKDVKIQVEFNPAVIRSYRLIGYENRMLAKEDFNDDSKDAGEIGAGHSVTALYELVPAGLSPKEGSRSVVDALKYQAAPAAAAMETAPAVSSDEALTVKLRYKEPEGETSQLIEVPVKASAQSFQEAGQEFKFSAAVAGFALLLRQSSHVGELTWDQVKKLAQEGKGEDPQGYRGEFLQLIEKARGLRSEP